MAEFTTLKVGGPAQALVMPADIAEIILLINGCRRENIPWCVVGGGSNLLIADEGVSGVVIVLGRDFADIRIIGKDSYGRTLVEAEAGCRLGRLLNWCQENELAGLEYAVAFVLDIGLVLYLLGPGLMPVAEGLPGPILLLLALVPLATSQLRRTEAPRPSRMSSSPTSNSSPKS